MNATPSINANRHQFGISSLFWMTAIAGLALAYLQGIESDGVLLDATIAVVVGIVVGLVVGQFGRWVGTRASRRANVETRRVENDGDAFDDFVFDAIFWATLIALFAFVATAGDPRLMRSHRLAWAMIGAVTGALASALFRDQIVANAVACAFAAGAVMGAFFLFARSGGWGSGQSFRVNNTLAGLPDLRFDLLAAPLIGVAVALFVRLLTWVETRRRLPRYITATWLLLAVIVGTVMSQ